MALFHDKTGNWAHEEIAIFSITKYSDSFEPKIEILPTQNDAQKRFTTKNLLQAGIRGPKNNLRNLGPARTGTRSEKIFQISDQTRTNKILKMAVRGYLVATTAKK